jgi:hypothetical protein
MATFMGDEYPGQHRSSGTFVEGKDTRQVIISGAEVLVLDYTGKVVIYHEPHHLPPNYYAKQLTCTRSPNSGNLVVGCGGYTDGSKVQQPALISTGYHTRRPDPGPE